MKGKYTEFLSNSMEIIETERFTGVRSYNIEEDKYTKVGQDAKLADFTYLLKVIDKLAGRSFSLIEACITDEKQQEAIKDSLRGIITEQRDKVYQEIVLGK